METKLLEIRDKATFIPCLAIAISGADGYLARRAGYRKRCILFGNLNGGIFTYDCHEWRGRTFPVAHKWIEENWERISDGQVIDVEFILGETGLSKQSEEMEVEAY